MVSGYGRKKSEDVGVLCFVGAFVEEAEYGYVAAELLWGKVVLYEGLFVGEADVFGEFVLYVVEFGEVGCVCVVYGTNGPLKVGPYVGLELE